jgi:hypothetical protein
MNNVADTVAAWWIAFGPHGPRATDPPGEWTRVWLYSFAGVGISAVVFFSISAFAKPPPRTMTKEWQEASNEYLKVRIRATPQVMPAGYADPYCSSPKTSTQCTVSAAKVTKAQAWFRASRPRLRASNWTLSRPSFSRLVEKWSGCTQSPVGLGPLYYAPLSQEMQGFFILCEYQN